METTSMAPEVMASLVIGGRYLLCLLAPLVPAIAIFKIFPDSKVFFKGPFQGLTVRAGGAFAGYVVTFLIALPMTRGIDDLATRLLKPVWTLEADVVVIDRDGIEQTLAKYANIFSVTVNPRLYQVGASRVTLNFPLTSDTWPSMLFEIPEFGAEFFDLKDGKYEVQRNEITKTIKIEGAVIIREQASPDPTF
jgi:hypothetical protein